MQATISNINLDESAFAKYQSEYAETNLVLLPDLLKTNALQTLLKKINDTTFETKFEGENDDKFGKVLYVPPSKSILSVMTFMLNDEYLFRSLEKITGCKPIDNFVGRIHRSENTDHGINWHGDNSDNRLLAITLSLGTEYYTGANFEIRKKGTTDIMRQISYIKAGDAIVFKIAPELEHRLSLLESGRRTVCVGWFRSKAE